MKRKEDSRIGVGPGPIVPLRKAARAAGLLGLAGAICFALIASDTQTWTQGSFEDFSKGVAKNLSTRSDGLLMLAPRSRELLRYGRRVPLGAGSGFEREPVRRRRHGREALRDSGRRRGPDGRRNGRPGGSRHRHRFARPRLCGYVSGWKGIPHRRGWQTGSFLRSQIEVHLGAGVRLERQPVCRHRRPRRDSPRRAGWKRAGFLPDGRDARPLDDVRRRGQSDCREPNPAAW